MQEIKDRPGLTDLADPCLHLHLSVSLHPHHTFTGRPEAAVRRSSRCEWAQKRGLRSLYIGLGELVRAGCHLGQASRVRDPSTLFA